MEGQVGVLFILQIVRWKDCQMHSLHKAFHEHPWKGRWVCATHFRLSDGKAGGSCPYALSSTTHGKADGYTLLTQRFPQTPMEGLVGVLSHMSGFPMEGQVLLLSTLAILDVFTLCGFAAAS